MTDSGKPHVVHVSSAHPWTDNRIHYREAVTLAEAGYRVSLVAVESAVDAPSTAVRVTKLPRLSRLKRIVVGGPRAIYAAVKTRAGIFHLHDPELLWSVPFLRLAGKKVIYDAHEDLPVQVLDKPYANAFVRPVLVGTAYLLLGLARLSNHVIAATEPIASRFPPQRVTVVRNYPPLRAEESSSVPILQRDKSAVYVGAIGTTRGAVSMVEMAGNEEFPAGWTFTLAGPGPAPLIEKLRQIRGWERTDYRGQIRPDAARDLILRSRVGLVVLAETRAYVESLPTKMFEYFAAGVPVIMSDFPLWRSIVEELDCGMLVDQTSPRAIAEAVARYDADPELLLRHSDNARRASTQLNWSREAPALESAYRLVLGQ